MRREVEVKILNIDVRSVRRMLRAFGARRTMAPTLLHEWYFTHRKVAPSFSSLRIRTEGPHTYVTCKRKLQNIAFEDREEIEVSVSNAATARELLEALGFTMFREREKIRESYRCGAIHVDIDEYPQLKPYMEIEGANERTVRRFVRDLGFTFSYTSAMTATEVIRSAGHNPDHLLFTKRNRTR